jgi:hypothetical protein
MKPRQKKILATKLRWNANLKRFFQLKWSMKAHSMAGKINSEAATAARLYTTPIEKQVWSILRHAGHTSLQYVQIIGQ